MSLAWFSYLALALPEGELPRKSVAGLPPLLVLLAVDLVQRRRKRGLRLGQRDPRRLGGRVRRHPLHTHRRLGRQI